MHSRWKGGFAHYLVTQLNEHWIDLPAISDIEETVPAFDDIPQRLEGCCTAITNRPCQNSSLVVIDCCPNPEFVALVANEGLQYTYDRSPLEFLQTLGHRAIDAQPLEPNV